MTRQINGWLVLTCRGVAFGVGRPQIPIDVDAERCSGCRAMCKAWLGNGSESERTLAMASSRGARE